METEENVINQGRSMAGERMQNIRLSVADALWSH